MSIQPRYKLEIAESGLTQRQWYSKIYLRSEHWKQLRQSKFDECGKKCEICGKTTTIEVHHLNYREIYDVLTSDLQVLCKKHHGEQHTKKPKNKKKRKNKVPRKIFSPPPPIDYDSPDIVNTVQSHIRGMNKVSKNRTLDLVIAKLNQLKMPMRLILRITSLKRGTNGRKARKELRKLSFDLADSIIHSKT